MDVFVVSDFMICEGGNVIGVAATLDAAKGIAQAIHPEPLKWIENHGPGWMADVPGSDLIREYHVQRFAVRA